MTATTGEDIFTDSNLTTSTNGAAQRNGSGVGTEGAGAAVPQHPIDDGEAVTVDAAPESPQGPMIKIVKGSPSDDEIAALVAVFAAVADSDAATTDSGRPPESWGAPSRMHRRPMPFSPYSFPNAAFYG